jgi:triosephosphate isomerase
MMKYLMANWKANYDLSLFLELVQSIPEGSNFVSIFPPFLALWPVAKNLPFGVNLGAQDVSIYQSGAHTGETSAEMLSAMGVHQVLLGHSERRSQGDDLRCLEQKLAQMTAHRLSPVLCIGANQKTVDDALIAGLMSQLPAGLERFHDFKIAYEPIFAIGTGEVADIDHIANVLKKLDLALSTRYPYSEIALLYGGSVKASNVRDILAIGYCSGVLVGNASIELKSWKELVEICRTFS